jgi:HIV-1 Vpr-binding protein
VILNSEVWDLRSDRLLRSVPGLDGTQLSWTGSGDVAMASFRLPKDEAMQSTMRKSKHPLRASFRTIDAADYSEISTVELERSLVDSCWDVGTDALCATVEYDAADTHESVVRVHEVGSGRHCPPRHWMSHHRIMPHHGICHIIGSCHTRGYHTRGCHIRDHARIRAHSATL